jgi:predicted MPP superfamily phosphohydrolase
LKVDNSIRMQGGSGPVDAQAPSALPIGHPGAGTDRFVILHLSDVHLGNPTSELNMPLVIEPLFRDLARMRDQYGLVPDLIVFNGDLAHGETPERPIEDQYGSECAAFLNRICRVFDRDTKTQPLLLVPGNHDIDRTVIAAAQTEWLERAEHNPETEDMIREAMRARKRDWTVFIERQQAWQSFMKSLDLPMWRFHDSLNISTGIIETHTRRIGIAGLNTSWSAGGRADKGRLWLGRHQVEQAIADLREGDADFRIVVMHHPPAWLNPVEGPKIANLLNQHFNVFMYGHEHEDVIEDSSDHLRIAAAATYESSVANNGYGWLRFDFAPRTVEAFLRQFREDAGPDWHPRVITGKTDDVGHASDLLFPERREVSTTAPERVRTERSAVSALKAAWAGMTAARPPQPLEAALKQLDDLDLIWEPESFRMEDERAVVFWPLRLRHPTPIHAAQAFAAAALSRGGAQIRLWIDDLGDQAHPVEDFRKWIEGWVLACGGSPPQVHRYTEVAGSHEMLAGWEVVRSWWGGDASIQDVLHLTKILPAGDLNYVRSRKLLTPATTWACLAATARDADGAPLITLGGHDERDFWATWTGVRPSHKPATGHLYIPELSQPHHTHTRVHMDRTHLGWKSRADVQEFIQREVDQDGRLAEGWYRPTRPIPWCVKCCVELPLRVRGEQPPPELGSALREAQRHNEAERVEELLNFVAGAVSDMLFGRALGPVRELAG